MEIPANSHICLEKCPFPRTVLLHPWIHTKEPLVPTASNTGQLSQRNEPTTLSLQNSRQLLHPFSLLQGKQAAMWFAGTHLQVFEVQSTASLQRFRIPAGSQRLVSL